MAREDHGALYPGSVGKDLPCDFVGLSLLGSPGVGAPGTSNGYKIQIKSRKDQEHDLNLCGLGLLPNFLYFVLYGKS